MKCKFFCFLLFFLFASCFKDGSKSIKEKIISKEFKQDQYSSKFMLTYLYVGMGSNMGNKFPVLKVNGTNYLYTRKQNSSWTGKFDKKTDAICFGEIRQTSIDSIIMVISEIKDTLIYETNAGVMSGGIDCINISFGNKSLKFNLHNASHPKATQIIKILNSNIPDEFDKLFYWKD